MSGDTFLPRPSRRAGRAGSASAPGPILDQEFSPDTLYLLRAAVQAHASRIGLPEDRVGEVVLALHELAANAIAHGAGHGRLRMWDQPGILTCEIADNGRADAPSSRGRADAPSSRGRADPDATRDGDDSPAAADLWPTADGHGLWLVRQVADQLDLRSGPRGTQVIVTFAMPLPEDH